MTHDEFKKLFKETIKESERILIKKGEEYATEQDRLHNFRTAAALQNCNMDEAVGGFLAKHVVSIYDLIHNNVDTPMEVWDEKILDAINYLILLRAVVVEMKNDRPASR